MSRRAQVIPDEEEGGVEGDAQKSWLELLDQDGDAALSTHDLNLSLYMVGLVLPNDAFHEVLKNPNFLENFIPQADFVSKIRRFKRWTTTPLMGTAEFTIKRWLSLTLCLGWAFLDHFYPPRYFGRGPVQRNRIQFLKNLVGVNSAVVSGILVVLPSIIAAASGTFHGAVKTTALNYFFGYSFMFCLPLSYAEATNYCGSGNKKQEMAYYSHCSCRYLRCATGLDGAFIYGHELYKLMIEEDFAFYTLPQQFDVVDEGGKRKQSNTKSIETHKESNPYTKQHIRHQTSFIFVGIFFGTGCGYYPIVRGIQDWPDTWLGIILHAIITFACAIGMHATFFAIVFRTRQAYCKMLWRIEKFRANTTSYALRLVGEQPYFSDNHQSETFNMLEDTHHVKTVLKLHDYLFLSTKVTILHHESTNNILIVLSVAGAGILLFLSFTYVPEYEHIFMMLVSYITLNLGILLYVLTLVVKINFELNDHYLKDLERIRYSLKMQGKKLAVVEVIDDEIRMLKNAPRYAGRMLGVRINAQHVAKLIVTVFAAMCSALLRVGIVD